MSSRADVLILESSHLLDGSIMSALYHIRSFLVWLPGSQPWVLLADEVVGIRAVGISPGPLVGVLLHAKAVHGHAELVA